MSAKSDQIKALREKSRRLEEKITPNLTPPGKPADDRPRWKDGTLRDRLSQLEHELDEERWPVDLAYFNSVQPKIAELMKLREDRDRKQRAADQEEIRRKQSNAQAEAIESENAAAEAAWAADQTRFENEVNAYYDRGGTGPTPKRPTTVRPPQRAPLPKLDEKESK